jgi:hypothetical protein
MGTKRVGLARTQALIQNLKRELDMKNSTLTNTKGVELCKYTAATAIPVATQNNDLWSVALPANALITDVGYMISGADVNAGSGTTLSIAIGDATGTGDIVAAVQVNQTSSDLANGVSQSVAAGNLPHASGAALGFAPAAPLFATAARSVFLRVTVGSTVLVDANGLLSLFVKYIIKE